MPTHGQAPSLRRVSGRPSMGGVGSPNLLERASTSMHRKASYNALVGSPATPTKKLVDNFEIGDVVNVPGDMFGTVKFVGSVRGKQGRFLGVQLDDDFADRGKNSGDVDGVNYFTATVPGSGIFLPVHRAERRYSPDPSFDETAEDSPDTPKASAFQPKRSQILSPGTPSVPKFSQTVGPGARPPSPQLKARPRQSLPRPESPLRRAPNLQPTPGRQFSQSVRPGSKPPTTPSARSVTPKLAASVRGGQPPRPYSRTGSRLGHRAGSISESSDLGVSTIHQPHRSPSRLLRGGDDASSLQKQLADRDRQLEEQAQQLVEMELSLKEIQALIPDASPTSSRKGSMDVSGDASYPMGALEMRRALREKNDKINSLITEFDSHRADFRSTIETLEMASDETVRMYETRIQELLGEIQNLRDNNGAQKEVEAIAGQMKMLEDLVTELEDGLEDARRGEAEARGEVEFLRGEVERGRSELKREREKAASLVKSSATNGSNNKDKDPSDRDRTLEMKDDEIRGLKAILHSVQSTEDADQRNDHDDALRNPSSSYSTDAEEMRRLQESLHKLEVHNAELEGQLRREQEGRRNDSNGGPSSTSGTTSRRQQGNDTARPRTAEQSAAVRCEGCDQLGHDILHCNNLGRSNGAKNPAKKELEPDALRTKSAVAPKTGVMTSTQELARPSTGKDEAKPLDTKKAVNEEKWCALCEQDGHLAFDCPNEQY